MSDLLAEKLKKYHAERRQVRVTVGTEVPLEWRTRLKAKAAREGRTLAELVRRGIALVLRGKADDREDRDVA